MRLILILGDSSETGEPQPRERIPVDARQYSFFSLTSQIDDAIHFKYPVNILKEDGSKITVTPWDWGLVAVERSR